jgi:hypothetical protein
MSQTLPSYGDGKRHPELAKDLACGVSKTSGSVGAHARSLWTKVPKDDAQSKYTDADQWQPEVNS